MAKGRKALPTAVKELRGNPGHRKLNKNEPKFSRSAMLAPKWLAPGAKEEWQRIVFELSSLDMLRGVDESALAGYCQSYARWKSAEAIIDAQGQTIADPITNKAGEVVGERIKRHPATLIAKDEKTAMQKFAALFGFDPSSRSRISLGVPKEIKTPLDAILDGDEDEGISVH